MRAKWPTYNTGEIIKGVTHEKAIKTHLLALLSFNLDTDRVAW